MERHQAKADAPKTLAPELLYAEPDLTIKVVRDVFNEDFQDGHAGRRGRTTSRPTYVARTCWTGCKSGGRKIFTGHRIDEQLIKALDRKVYLPPAARW